MPTEYFSSYDGKELYAKIAEYDSEGNRIANTLSTKVDKVEGKGLSTEDYTSEEKTKLASVESGANVNIQADWNQADDSADDYIKNKPSVGTIDILPPPAANTLRLQSAPGVTPVTNQNKGTLVDLGNDIWDWTYDNASWSSAFYVSGGNTTIVKVLDSGDNSSVTSMFSLFGGCTSLTDVAWIDTHNVTDTGYMFNDCQNLTSIALFNTSKVTSMTYMFNNCNHLTNIPLYDTSSVTNMNNMFKNCSGLTSVPKFDTHNVTNMQNMFEKCSSLTTVPTFDMRNVTNMAYMFSECSALVTVPCFDTSNVTNMNNAFYRCGSLDAVPLFDTTNVTSVVSMFRECRNVRSGAYALYSQLSTQANVPTYYGSAFTNCGADTVTGAMELQQIPSSWGGTAQ